MQEMLTMEKLTDSPVSISSRDSQQHDHLDAGPLPTSRNGPGNLRRMTVGLLSRTRMLHADFWQGSVSISSARTAGSGVEGEHVGNNAGAAEGSTPLPGSPDIEHTSQHRETFN